MKKINWFLLLYIYACSTLALAEKLEIKSGEKYYNREVINRILDIKDLEDKNKSKVNIEISDQVVDAYEPEDKANNKYQATFGACDIFDKDETASFTLTLRETVEMSLQNNIALEIEKLNPEISATNIESAKAEFGTKLSGKVTASDKLSRTINAASEINRASSNSTQAEFSVENKSVSGVKTSVSASVNRNRNNNASSLYQSRLGIDVTAPLMRGKGKDVNLVSLRKAELDLGWSKYELYGYILDFVSETEKIYWENYLAFKQLEIVKESLSLAAQQRDETNMRIKVGKIAESELAAADAEVALCQEDLINAESKVVSTSVSLLRRINPDSKNFWRKRLHLQSIPKLRKVDEYDFSLEDCLADSMMLRPELRQAELMLRKNDLEVVASKNGMLPKLDFFIALGKTGYAKSFDKSSPEFHKKDPFDASVGLIYEHNVGRRAEKAKLDRANLNVRLQKESMKNLEQVIQEEVIKAYIEIKRTKEQLVATSATTQKQIEKLRVEKVKFDVGKTTAFQVAQAQRDVTAAKIAEVKAIIDYTVSKSELLRSTGLLLQYRGIEVTGK